MRPVRIGHCLLAPSTLTPHPTRTRAIDFEGDPSVARIGAKLYYLRTRERRLSQQQAADGLGIRQATLSHL